ncbi:MAG: hypothetical protein R6U95_08660 [Bacteroidales bacterium]
MKKLSIIIIGLSLASFVFGQNYKEALRYSESFPLGSARFTSMSGAFGALGGNISGLGINPAGSGVFKQNAIEFTPAFLHTKTQNYYQSNYDASFNSSMAIPNFGVAFSTATEENDLFVSGITFVFGINRSQNFNEIANFNVFNTQHSLTDDFIQRANISSNNTFEPYYTKLAWETYLFDYNSEVDLFESDFRWYDNNHEYSLYAFEQDINKTQSGEMKEYMFNLGIDFSEKVYVGASFNVETINYSETFDIRESDVDNNYYALDEYTYSTSLDVSGSGVNGKIGVIVQPHNMVRLGFAAHSPTMFSLDEVFDASVDANYDIRINETDYSLYDEYGSDFSYKIRKPGKFVSSASFIYKNIAVVGFDYEHVNYAFSQISSDKYSFSSENEEIKNELSSVNNLKFGAELRYGPFSFRGGFAVYENPYTNRSFENWYYRRDFSGGIGISNNNFYCDLSWVKSKQFGYEDFYTDFDSNLVSAKSDSYSDNIFVTFGLKF